MSSKTISHIHQHLELLGYGIEQIDAGDGQAAFCASNPPNNHLFYLQTSDFIYFGISVFSNSPYCLDMDH